MSNQKVFTVTDQDFKSSVLGSPKPVLVDLWAEWCGPCRALAPIIDEIADEFAGQVKVAKLDIDANPATPAQYGVRGIPTVLVFKDGKVVDQLVGKQSKESYTQLLRKYAG
ncbi:MAG: thioredoxin [Bacteriovoracia bacterium]